METYYHMKQHKIPTTSTAIQFSSQARNIKIVGQWMKADKASFDVGL